MAIREKRIAPRFDVRLQVTLKIRERALVAETSTASRHGVFIATPHLRTTGELLQLQIRIPSGPAGPSRTITVMSVVARTVTAAEAEHQGLVPGMGMKFFMIGSEDNTLWEAFISSLENGKGAPPPGPLLRPENQEPVRFLIRARNLDQLRRFGVCEMARKEFFLRSPLVRRSKELIEVVLIHPETHEEFALAGRVKAARATGAVSERGMDIEFLRIDSKTQQEFDHFVAYGSIRSSSLAH